MVLPLAAANLTSCSRPHFFLIREFKLHLYGKRQIQVENFSDKNSSKQFLWIENCVKLLNLGVEIMNSKREVERKLGHVVQIRRLPFDVN